MEHNSFTPPSSNTHFLVSGGGKGITAENAIALAKEFQSRFTLLGRSDLLDKEPDWAQAVDSEADLKKNLLNSYQANDKKITPKEMDKLIRQVMSSREIQNTLHQIEQAGGESEYIQVDITDIKDLEDKIKPLASNINALLHGAGALADKFIEDKKESDFELVYGVKVDGLKNLLKIVSPENLEYLILFSSVAGFYGNAGQADYSLSNEILNKLAHHLHQQYPSCHVLAIDWGPWDGGMVSPQLKRILIKKNVQVISVEDGTQTLINLLSQPVSSPQWVVGSPMPRPSTKISDDLKRYRIVRNLSLEANPFLADHVIGGNAVLPTVCAVGWFVNSCERLYPNYKFFSVNDYQVFKGILFDEDSSSEYLLELEETQKSTKSVVFMGKISSETPEGKLRYHYQAQVELRKTIPDRPQFTEINLIKDASFQGKDLYGSKNLFHGPSFQGVKEILNLTPTGLTLRCNLPSFPKSKMGQFPAGNFNPYMADVHLQSLLIWAWDQLKSTGLPLIIKAGTQYKPTPFDTDTYATMQVVSNSKHKLVANVISHDLDGNIFTNVSAAEITLNTTLLDLFKQNQLSKDIIWQ